MKKLLYILGLGFSAHCLHSQSLEKDSLAIAKLSHQFELLKTKLECPLKNSVVDYHMLYLDEQRRPTRGVDLVSDSLSVYVPFEGFVTGVFPSDDTTQSIIVNHGNYFTVYSHLSNVYVKPGKRLSSGEMIGKVKRDMKQTPRLHFEIWFESEKLWPPDWLLCAKKK